MFKFKTHDPRTQTWTEADGIDAYVGRDENGFPVYRSIAATEEQKLATEIDGYKRDVAGAEQRLVELEQMAENPDRFGTVEPHILAGAQQRKANALRELERLGAIDKPKGAQKK